MPIEELEQALLEAKWGDAEETAMEVIARILDVPQEVVERAAFAWDVVREIKRMDTRTVVDLPGEVANALRDEVRRGLLRIRVRECIRDETNMHVDVSRLPIEVGDVCKGCQFSMTCVTENLSTPAKCYAKGPPGVLRTRRTGETYVDPGDMGGTRVWPIKIRGDRVTVTCPHPVGEYVLDVGVLRP